MSTVEYKYIELVDGDIEECGSCFSPAPLRKFYDVPEGIFLCELCANIPIPKKGEAISMRQIAAAMNVAIDIITKRRES